MTLEPGTRRGFIAGLAALVTAPAIIRVESLMPVKFVDGYDTRCLWDYYIGTDEYRLRIDKALHTLHRPRNIIEVPLALAKRVIPDCPIFDERPASGVQRFVIAILPAEQRRQLVETIGWMLRTNENTACNSRCKSRNSAIPQSCGQPAGAGTGRYLGGLQ